MRVSNPLLLICSFSSLATAATAQSVLLKGTVVGRDSKAIYLLPRTQSVKSDHLLEIPIRDGRFEYTMQDPGMAAYRLIFKDELDVSVYRPIEFFPDTAVIKFLLHPMQQAGNNKITGGAENRTYYAMKEAQLRLFNDRQQMIIAEERRLKNGNLFWSDTFATLQDKSIKEKNINVRQKYYDEMNVLQREGKHLGDSGKVWTRRSDSLKQDIVTWRYSQIGQRINFAHYYMLFDDVVYQAASNRLLVPAIGDTYQRYLQAYPDHAYTRQIADGVSGLLQIFPGKTFVDFTAPDLQGKQQQLASLIKGKLALVDLWGSWCGPCIAKTRKVAPLYEKYKSKGFTVVGVAREFDNTKAMKKRLKTEKWSWTQLVELDDQNGIWNKYGVQNNAGLVVLIDAGGKILAVDPTIEELTQYLAVLD